ncbi:hypothetical protein EI427_07515 [Flammeovirga pectinis]|uniref:Uncharacterized protein n=1 Tax=Flammeovirga pectinis TaxID=2494373 RepID=A0A3Q9FMJ4_9BACT|nr:hypothetical protein [Flammeovirga pectinis]AZQ62093.1 hypothetical protein EI427_07515 [Flammeovirga pectinis]
MKNLFKLSCIVVLSLLGSYFYMSEHFVALMQTALYLLGTVLIVVLPFILFDKKSLDKPKENKTIEREKTHEEFVKTLQTTLLEKGDKESIYMSIYKVDNSP